MTDRIAEDARFLLLMVEWLSISQASRVQGCSERKVKDMIREGLFGKSGTVKDNLLLRDLNPNGRNRQYRLHRSLFGAAQERGHATSLLPDKPPVCKRQKKSADEGFAAWFIQRERKHG